MVTVDPRRTLVPAAGACFHTRPAFAFARLRSDSLATMVFARRCADSIWATAADEAIPKTSGTPVPRAETVSVTVVPVGCSVPPRGDTPITTPGGYVVDPSSRVATSNPSDCSARTALFTRHRSTGGTLTASPGSRHDFSGWVPVAKVP